MFPCVRACIHGYWCWAQNVSRIHALSNQCHATCYSGNFLTCIPLRLASGSSILSFCASYSERLRLRHLGRLQRNSISRNKQETTLFPHPRNGRRRLVKARVNNTCFQRTWYLVLRHSAWKVRHYWLPALWIQFKTSTNTTRALSFYLQIFLDAMRGDTNTC